MIPNADIRPADIASGTGLAIAVVAVTVLAYLGIEPPPAVATPEVIRIRALPPAAFAAAGTLQASAGAPAIATTAPAKPPRRPARRSSAKRSSRRSASALPDVAPEPAPAQDTPAEPTELPSLLPDDPLPADTLDAADTDDADALDEPDAARAEAPPPDAVVADTDGAGGGGDEGLAAMAVAAYRSRLAQWMAAQFQVRGTGLDRNVLTRLRGRAQITLDESRVVLDFDYTSSGNAAFDAAALQTLEELRGQVVPAPPEAFPGALQRHLTVTFVCKASTCD